MGDDEVARTLAEDTPARCRRILGDGDPLTLDLDVHGTVWPSAL